mgnify:CR=1 FL=1
MSEKILVTGSKSKIARKLIKLIPNKNIVKSINSKNIDFSTLKSVKEKKEFFLKFDKIFFFHSKIGTERINFKNIDKINEAVCINLLSQIYISEYCLQNNKKVKIFFIGSESGVKGSYDIIYGLMKSAIHKYVEERKLSYPKQKIFCLAPSTIIDSNFTKLRKDQKNVTKSINQNPKKRGIFSREVSEIIYEIMFKKKFDYLSNTVIHLDGGKFARM